MATLNELFNGALEHRLGVMDDEIRLVPTTEVAEYIVHPSNKKKIFAADVQTLVHQAQEFNLWDKWKDKISTDGLPKPAYCKPDINGQYLSTEDLTTYQLQNLLSATTGLPVMVPDVNKTQINLDQKTFALGGHNYPLSPTLLDHVQQGKHFWLYNNNGKITWYTRAEIQAQSKWKQSVIDFNQSVLNWFDFLDDIHGAQVIFNAIEQKQRLSSLPFSWYAAVKVVLSGLSANSWGDGEKSNTVCHLVVAEDYSAERLSRSKDSFLCTAGGFMPAAEAKKEYQVTIRGYVVEHIPHTITCKACLSRIEHLINRTGS